MNRRYWMKQSKQENLIYLAVWGLLFAAPLLSLYVRAVNDANFTFDWTEVFLVWRQFAVYLLLFLVHNFLLAPLLVHQHKRVAYFSIVVAVMIAFTVYQCSSRPGDFMRHQGPPPHLKEMERPDFPDKANFPDRPDFPDRPNFPDKADFPEAPEHPMPPRHEMPEKHGKPEIRRHDPPPFVGEHDILAVVVLLLMFGANLGIKSYFRSRDDRKRLAALEKKNLEQQLEYLRYQINPHFFMNTLNNIHALIDIDPTKAQETILELSKMMRYVLYEGDRKGVPLTKEVAFIRTYVKLMQLRYTDKVHITLDLPTEVPERQIPPLILITFIENAFKHGVSYQHESFIEIRMAVEGESLRFECRNSKAEVPNEEKGGVGLANVRKRLNLLFEHNYTLSIHNEPQEYIVELNIPLS